MRGVPIGRSGNGENYADAPFKPPLHLLLRGDAGRESPAGQDGPCGHLPQWERYSKRVGCVFQDPKSQFFSGELAGKWRSAAKTSAFRAEIGCAQTG